MNETREKRRKKKKKDRMDGSECISLHWPEMRSYLPSFLLLVFSSRSRRAGGMQVPLKLFFLWIFFTRTINRRGELRAFGTSYTLDSIPETVALGIYLSDISTRFCAFAEFFPLDPKILCKLRTFELPSMNMRAGQVFNAKTVGVVMTAERLFDWFFVEIR